MNLLKEDIIKKLTNNLSIAISILEDYLKNHSEENCKISKIEIKRTELIKLLDDSKIFLNHNLNEIFKNFIPIILISSNSFDGIWTKIQSFKNQLDNILVMEST